ncbi:MAG: ABC transporter ATP-binding protein [Crenarchaeota archaeon]|nr:ABC transporter ATP-binding protein [Thermoproteota archaeon]
MKPSDIVVDVKSAGYRNKLVFENLRIKIPSGKITALLGPNGSGKTTLLKMLFRRIKYSGKILIGFKELAEMSNREIARLISYMGEIALPDMMGLKVFEALLISRSSLYRGLIERQEDIREAEAVLRELGIEHLSERRLDELSSGELRKVVLGMALIKHPKYLLLDEPDSHLDMLSRIEISRIIKKYSGRTTIIIATHDPVFAVNTAEYFVLLRDGRVVDEGNLERIVGNKSIEKTFGVKLKYIYEDNRLVGIIPIYD